MKLFKLIELYASQMNKFGMIGFAAMIGISIASLNRLQLDIARITPLFFLAFIFAFIWLVGHHVEKTIEKRAYSEVDEEKMAEFQKKLAERKSEDEFIDI